MCAAAPAVLGVRTQVAVEVRSPSSGFVGEYFANEGDTVAVGQPLFRLTAGKPLTKSSVWATSRMLMGWYTK